jgi:ADP-heptose:LPS heptosyltransferase
MVLTLKTFIKFIIYYFISTVVAPSKEIKENSLLLIRLDAIGDYVIFRNFIKELKQSQKYKNYRITLLGNSTWKNIAEEFDSEFVDSFIWLDRNRFNKDFIYRYEKLKEITLQGYEVVLSPIYSREFFYADAIVNLINAKEKIGSVGDVPNMEKWQKNISNKYYDRFIDADVCLMFEFDRNKEFFENLLDVKLEVFKPHISLNSKKIMFELPQKYAIIFLGASASFRKWNIEGFAEVAKHLKEKYGYGIVLCGALSDSADSLEFGKHFKGKYIDLVGKTSLVDLLHVIYNGDLMVANETSAPHFAIALEMANIFVIYNGNHYGRFTPYPERVSKNYHVIYHPEIEKDLDDYEELSNSYEFRSSLDINDITKEKVIEKINSVVQL